MKRARFHLIQIAYNLNKFQLFFFFALTFVFVLMSRLNSPNSTNIISAYHANLDYSKTIYSNYFIIFIHWYSNRSSIFYQWLGKNNFYNLFNIILLFRGNKKIIKNSVRFAYFHKSFYLSPFFLFFFFGALPRPKKKMKIYSLPSL